MAALSHIDEASGDSYAGINTQSPLHAGRRDLVGHGQVPVDDNGPHKARLDRHIGEAGGGGRVDNALRRGTHGEHERVPRDGSRVVKLVEAVARQVVPALAAPDVSGRREASLQHLEPEIGSWPGTRLRQATLATKSTEKGEEHRPPPDEMNLTEERRPTGAQPNGLHPFPIRPSFMHGRIGNPSYNPRWPVGLNGRRA